MNPSRICHPKAPSHLIDIIPQSSDLTPPTTQSKVLALHFVFRTVVFFLVRSSFRSTQIRHGSGATLCYILISMKWDVHTDVVFPHHLTFAFACDSTVCEDSVWHEDGSLRTLVEAMALPHFDVVFYI